MERLTNSIQPYAWGSRTAIAALQGRPPADQPEAELWLGAHPAAPSRVADGRSLEAVLTENPSLLGSSAQRFGAKLPFLLKVLAAEVPLSLQAHPSLQQAREGFAREEAAGVPRGAPHRLYKDANHKPELICALTPFEALCGFRRVEQTLALFDALDVEVLKPLLAVLRTGAPGAALAAFFSRVMTLERARQAELVARVVEACAQRAPSAFAAECAWAVRLNAQYPGDPGVIGALLLNLVVLAPLEALYLPAGNLHAYLHGTGIEVMASSDNVLRGGLTPKHVDVAELLRVVSFEAVVPEVLRGEGAPEATYRTSAPEFRLSRLEVHAPLTLTPSGPEIWLCERGVLTAGVEALTGGGALFLGANEGPVLLSGEGVVWRATVGA